MLPFWIETGYRFDALNDAERRFFTDKSLRPFWAAADRAIRAVDIDSRSSAAIELPDQFLVPRREGFGLGMRHAESVAPRQDRRRAELDSRRDLGSAADLAARLADALDDLEDLCDILPDEMRLLHLAQTALPVSLPSYFVGYRTSDALRTLAARLADLSERPLPRGLESQKASWRDWAREARQNVAQWEDRWGAQIEITESMWHSLVRVLIDPLVSRDAVHDWLRQHTQRRHATREDFPGD
jgi:hypothetical protein